MDATTMDHNYISIVEQIPSFMTIIQDAGTLVINPDNKISSNNEQKPSFITVIHETEHYGRNSDHTYLERMNPQ